MKIVAALILLLATSAQAAPVFNGNPLATHPIFIDCDTYPWTAPDDVILKVCRLLAGIFSPFDVNLTTVRPPPQPNVPEVVMGGPLIQPGNIAGQSVIGNWTIGTQFDTPGFPISAFAARVYADGLGNNPTLCAYAAAHELGHNLGLIHEDSGIMFPTLIIDPLPTWTVADVAYMGSPERLGFAAPVPDPRLLLLVLPLLMHRRMRGGIIHVA